MANEMRDRLTEYIENAKKLYEGDVTDLSESEYVAECLLTEGVIVPPCKVGDAVYAIWQNEVLKAKVGNIHITTYKERTTMWLGVSIREKYGAFTFSKDLLLGYSVFPTKEQAEQKLKEMRGKND